MARPRPFASDCAWRHDLRAASGPSCDGRGSSAAPVSPASGGYNKPEPTSWASRCYASRSPHLLTPLDANCDLCQARRTEFVYLLLIALGPPCPECW
jgi:hypothetical protein